MSPATKPEEEVTPETAVPKRTVEEDVKSSVKRELFPTTFKEDGESALPEEVSQASNDKWVEANGAKGLIKLRGEGRTAEVVRSDMQLYALGMMTATAKAAAAAEVAVEAALASLLVTPEEKQAALDAWVKENVGDERGGLLKLRGEGRTAEKLAAEVGLVVAGAKALKEAVEPSALPEEVSQASNDKWVEANGAKGLIKLRGEGRTAEVVRSDMQLYALGMMTATAKAAAAAEVAVEAALASLLVTPEEKQAALDAWVKENVGDERGGLLKLRGEGRTAEKLAAEVGLVVAGAKYVKSGNVPKEGAARNAEA